MAASIVTKAIRPMSALVMAALLNVVGAVISTKVAATVGEGIITVPTGTHGLIVVFAALLGAIGWNLITWWFGLPTSSTHALIGALVGAGLASANTVPWRSLVDKVILPMALSPIVGFLLGLGGPLERRPTGRLRVDPHDPGGRGDRRGLLSAGAPRRRLISWS